MTSMAARSCFLLPLLFFPLSSSPAQAQFTEVGTNLFPLKYSAIDWGDYDGDGDLDVAIQGISDAPFATPQTAIYTNQSGNFSDLGANLNDLDHGVVSWADFDGDGYIDLLSTGVYGGTSAETHLYRNIGGSFQDYGSGLPAVFDCSVDWADFDGDGDLDLVLVGDESGGGSPISGVFRNDGNGGFTYAGGGLVNVLAGSVAFGDYDNDGDPDLLLTGRDYAGTAYAILYRNDAGTFVDSGIPLPGVYDSAVAWMDADNDGDLDFVLTGRAPLAVARVYTNMGGGSFAANDLPAPALAHGTVAWGDYDADGYPDLLLTGEDDAADPHTQLYHNNAGGSYTLQSAGLDNVRDGAARWGDYDNDNRLDILLTGFNGSTPVTRLYHNTGSSLNSPPSSPSGLFASRNATTATFTWIGGSDGQTASPGLSYNLRIGGIPGQDDIMPAMSNASTGYHQVVRLGNRGHSFSWTVPVAALPPTVYWTVQTIDPSLTGSLFPSEQTFVVMVPTTTDLASAPNPSNVGQNVTLTATVSPSSATGIVTFKDGAATLGTGSLSGGVATFFTSSLTNGSHTLTAQYAGDPFSLSSTSSPVTQVVTTQTISSTALNSSPNPSQIGQTVTLTATVTPSSSTGSVSFKDGTTNLGSAPLSGGVATRTTSSLAGGSHSLTAVYGGNASTLGSTSPVVTHIVKQNTTTAINSAPNPSAVGEMVTLTATVTPSAATGTVNFTDNNVNIGSGTLSGGTATFTTSSLTFGNHPLRAVYVGDGSYNTSTSTVRNQNVLLATSTALASNPNPCLNGDQVTLTATVTPSNATGQVTFKDGTVTLGTRNLQGGVATLDFVFGPLGNNSLTAIYLGNPQYITSTSPAVNQVVQSTTTTTLSTAPNPSTPGQNVTLTAVVSPSQASGTVTFKDGASVVGAVSLSAGQAVFNTSALALGTHSLTAEYAGDGTYRPSTSSAVSQIVEVFIDMAAGLPGIASSAASWGDYDNDGDLDVLLTGFTNQELISRIYRNSGGSNPTFTDAMVGLPGVFASGAAWGDYDNDGDLDILLAGYDLTANTARIFRNNGGANPTFTDIQAGLTGVQGGSCSWGDYDNDGDLDALITGATETDATARIYRNSGGSNPTFTDIAAGLQPVGLSTAAWGDYDNDGDLDILLIGRYYGPHSIIYRNNGGANPTFTDIGAGLQLVDYGVSVAWGDYDNDGDLDILISGEPGNTVAVSKIYRNSGGPSPTFADINAALPGVEYASVAWGDYDNDGYLDILLTGSETNNGGPATTRICRSSGGPNPTFTDVTALVAADMPAVQYSSVAWGDCDNDGDLDILLTGSGDAGVVSRIYRNSATTANTPPTTPTNLAASITGNQVTFSWNASTDTQTPAAGLSYNLRVGTTPGGNEITAAMANNANGYRRVVAHGNAQKRTSWTLTLPSMVPLYWSVQAVDAAWAGSPFAAERLAGPFTEVGTGLPGLTNTACAWGDYDNDGDLDLLMTGDTGGSGPISRIYRNSGGANPTFTNIGAALAPFMLGACAWGDYDNDGDLDVLVTGVLGAGNTKLYRNSGGANPTFTDAGGSLPAVHYASLAWGDYDNDGDPDLALSGMDNTGTRICQIYRNSGGANPTFTDITAGLPNVGYSALAWGDYDRDGDLDLLVTGYNTSLGPISRVYRNSGGANPSFSDIGAGLPGIDFNSAAWGDYDNDGDLDLVLAGSDPSFAKLCRIYRNAGGANPTFTDINAGLPGLRLASVAWGDFDNDGNLDLLITGDAGSGTPMTRIYRNSGGPNPTFSDIAAGLTGVMASSASWVDYDNDGDLDLLASGDSGAGLVSKLYRNTGVPANTPPTAPGGLTSNLVGNQLTFSWNAATDAQTPAASLSYNLRIGTTPGGNQVTAAMADNATGYRRVVAHGNTQERTSWTIKVPNSGPYYWTVQAVDGAWAGSPFAAEQQSSALSFADIGAGLPPLYYGSVATGDYDNDGDLDIVMTGTNGGAYSTRIYRNNGGPNPTFTDIGAGLSNVFLSSVAWGDYDNDGDLDLLLTGRDQGNVRHSQIYRNSGGPSPTFTDNGAGLPGIDNGSVAWGDYDNDGDLDILLVGTAGTAISRIYRNNGGANPTFTDIAASLPGFNSCSVASWGDYDNDGDLDILLVGDSGGIKSRVYRNSGGANPTFTDISAGLLGVYLASAAWGDYDNDGDLDIILTGYDGNPETRIYRNNGGPNPTFTDIAAGLPGVWESAVAWGDFDNDGDLDLLLVGDATQSGNSISRIYRNSGGPNPTFTDMGAGMTGVFAASVAPFDYDNDGDLDCLIMGTNNAVGLAQVYRSSGAPQNTPPAAPTGLASSLNGTQITLSWTAATDNQTPAAGLSYNLRIGTTPLGNEIKAAMASETSGYRRIVAPGNAQLPTSWTFKLPNTTTVYWSVQAIDGAFAGGPWAAAGQVSAAEAPTLPTITTLGAASPNPFQGSTRISFDLPADSRVTFRVFDVRGRLVRTLTDANLTAGRHDVLWDGADDTGLRQGGGVYFVRMETPGFEDTRRVILVP